MTPKDLLSAEEFEDHLTHQSRSTLIESTRGRGWHGLHLCTFDQAEGTFTVPPLDCHLLFIGVGELTAAAAVVFPDLTGRHVGLVHPDTLFFIPAGNPMRFEIFGGTAATTHLLIPKSLTDELLAEETDDDPRAVRFEGFCGHPLLPLREIAAAAVLLLSRDDAEQAQRIARDLTRGLIRFASDSPVRREGRPMLSPMQLTHAFELLEATPHLELTTEEIARYASADPATFPDAFENAADISVDQYRAERRLDRARDLLTAHADIHEDAIARMVGYTDRSGLDQAFRNGLGISLDNWKSGRLA